MKKAACAKYDRDPYYVSINEGASTLGPVLHGGTGDLASQVTCLVGLKPSWPLHVKMFRPSTQAISHSSKHATAWEKHYRFK